MSTPQFYTWRHRGQQYLAAPAPCEGWHIIRDDGENYGAWRDVETFRAMQRAGDPNGQLGLPGTVAWPAIKVGQKMSYEPTLDTYAGQLAVIALLALPVGAMFALYF